MACVTTSIPADGGPVGTPLPPGSPYCPPRGQEEGPSTVNQQGAEAGGRQDSFSSAGASPACSLAGRGGPVSAWFETLARSHRFPALVRAAN